MQYCNKLIHANGGLTIKVVTKGGCSEDKDGFEFFSKCSDIEGTNDLVVVLHGAL